MSAFVGRSSELEALAEIVARSSTGPVAALVVGQPGSGKSRLLAEARSRAELPYPFSVVGYEAERHVPLAAAAGVLRTLAEVPEHGPHLEALLFRPLEATGLEPVRVFEAALRAFRALEPALLIVDDLQWVDELSLALCHYLVRAAQDSGDRVAMFAATRPGGSGLSLTDALPPERVTVIDLTPLSREEGIELVLAIDADLDRIAAQLWEQARGSPFWLEALAQAGGSVAGLGEFLTGRLRGAGSDAGTLLGLLAVAGRPISVADAAALAEWPNERLVFALGELVDRGLAIEAGWAPRLTHDLIRQAAIAELPEGWRRRVHHSLAERLEDEAGADVRLLREALEHRRAAGLDALDLATRLARSPHRTLLGQEGLALLGVIADEADPGNGEALALVEYTASLATELALHEEALAQWLLVAERADEPVRRASALLAASKASFELARGAEARELLARSRQIDAADQILDLEQRTHEAAILLWLEQQTAEGRVLARDAVAAAARLTDQSGRAAGGDDRRLRHVYLEALRLSYEAAMQEEDYEALLRVAQRREAEARGFDLDVFLTASLAVGVALRHNGLVREGLTRLRNVWEETHRHVLPRLAVEAGYWLARSLQFDGELVEAERVILEASALAARAGDVPRTRYRVSRGECSIALDSGEHWAALQRLENEVATEPSEHMRMALHGDLAVWYSRLRGPAASEAVRYQVGAGQACAKATGCPRCAAELLLFSAEALARIGDRASARRMLTRWDGRGVRPAHIDVLVRSHAGALSEDEPATRAASLEAALGTAEDSPYRLVSLWMRLDLGVALAGTDRDRAVRELEAVAEVASELGAGTVRDLAEQALRSLGVRTWRRGRVEGALTRREQEVARLVAGGATNNEIAKLLFLSAKTVERHVSNVLKKIGARNRTELASRLRDSVAKHAGNPR